MDSGRKGQGRAQVYLSKELPVRTVRNLIMLLILVFTIILPTIYTFNNQSSANTIQAGQKQDAQEGQGVRDAQKVQDAKDAKDPQNAQDVQGAQGAQAFSSSTEDVPQENYRDSWFLIVINSDNPVPPDYQVELSEISEGVEVDQRCVNELQNMLNDCAAAGYSPLVCSSYRTQETQEALFSDKYARLLSEGYSVGEAYSEADRSVALPGTSEHQIGLAVDIVDEKNQVLLDEQANTPTQQWLMQNSWRYGFILRYGADKTDITKKIYEPWHYRYVGQKDAQAIYEQGICLEEYVENI